MGSIDQHAQEEGPGEHLTSRDYLNAESPSQHPVFYLSGQTVVFKVQNTLFKVDPALFTNGESSVFKTMLTLPQEVVGRREGLDDANPIVLQGDTPAEFESLISGLYSQHLSKAIITERNAERFFQLAMISYKYDLRELESWATSGLCVLSQENAAIRASQAEHFLEIFALCNCTTALEFMVKAIREMFAEKTCSTAQVSALIITARKYNLSTLASLGYYTMMLKPRSDWEAEPYFTLTHQHRLLNGYFRLSEYPFADITKSLGDEFGRLHGSSWATVWAEYAVASKVLELSTTHQLKTVDILGRLRCLVAGFLAKYPADAEGGKRHIPRFRSVLEAKIESLINEDLPKLFVDLQ